MMRFFTLFLCGLVLFSFGSGCEDDYSSLEGDFAVYATVPKKALLPQASSSTLQAFPMSSDSFVTTHFTGSKACSTCHDEAKDTKGNSFPIVKDWSSTMMANAARDPFWQAKVASEIKRAPQLKAVLAQKCSRCHSPMAVHESLVQKKPYQQFQKEVLNPKHTFFSLAMAGVGCTFCHQIKDTKTLGTALGSSGRFTIETFKKLEDRKIYGPFDDVLTQPMQDNVSYTPTGSKHIRSSRLCSTCHDLKTPYVNAKGQVIPKKEADYFPEQMTFSEWKQSRFSKKLGTQDCQWCHMKPVKSVKLSFGPPWLKPRNYIRRHAFLGSNAFMLRMFRDNRKALGIRANRFDESVKQANLFIRAGIQLSILEKKRAGGRLLFKVQLKNKAGHKFPTGYPSRRAFLHVQVKSEAGKVLFESGKVLAQGHIVGVDAEVDALAYEPHYDRITRPDQVQVYESIMGNAEGQVTYTLLRAAHYKKDNRLLPEGFDKAKASRDTKVVGFAANDANFLGGSDVVTYDLRGFPSGALTVVVRFRFQSLSYRSALDLFRDKSLPLVDRFLLMYRKSNSFVETLASVSFVLP